MDASKIEGTTEILVPVDYYTVPTGLGGLGEGFQKKTVKTIFQLLNKIIMAVSTAMIWK